MKRPTSSSTRLFLLCAAAAAAVLAVPNAAFAQASLGSFTARPSYTNIPNVPANTLVFYNLPTAGSVHAGPATGLFDLVLLTNNTQPLEMAGYASIMTILAEGGSPANGVTFNFPAIVAGANNVNPGLINPINLVEHLDVILGEADTQHASPPAVPNLSGTIISVAEEFPDFGRILNHNAGLAAVPVQIAAGASGLYSMSFVGGDNVTGFFAHWANAGGEFEFDQGLTDTNAHPHGPVEILVRQSIPGDLNGDGAVNTLDIENFVNAILDFNAFQATRPWLQAAYVGDLNNGGVGDGNVNTLDIEPFVNLLLGGGGAATAVAVPEPSSLVLGVVGFVGTAVLLRRRRIATVRSS